MPSTSIAQQRLMGMAYAYKKGEPRSSFMVHGSVAKGEWNNSEYEAI